MDMYRFFIMCVLFTGLGAVSVLFVCSKTMRDMKTVVEDTIVGCFEYFLFLNLSVVPCVFRSSTTTAATGAILGSVYTLFEPLYAHLDTILVCFSYFLLLRTLGIW